MAFAQKIQNANSVGQLLLARPGQIRNVRRWVTHLKRPPLTVRLPWLPFDVIDFLDAEVRPTSRVFEFGGGGSTLWFTERAGFVRTVENDHEWFEGLTRSTAGLTNSDVIFRPMSEAQSYVRAVEDEEPWDIVVVDGRERVQCAEAALPYVRRGGLLVLDDSDRPRYSAVEAALQHWPATTFRGLAPYKPVPAHTTVWRRPAD